MSVQEIGGSVTNMMWRPKLIRMTNIDIDPDTGKVVSETCFVSPDAIYQISPLVAVFTAKVAGEELKVPVKCTQVFGAHIRAYVSESPEVVAAMRDEAMGFAPEIKGRVERVK